MEASFIVSDPDEITMEMTIKMPLRKWKQLRQTFVNKYPAWEFSTKIGEMIDHADKHFYPKEAE